MTQVLVTDIFLAILKFSILIFIFVMTYKMMKVLCTKEYELGVDCLPGKEPCNLCKEYSRAYSKARNNLYSVDCIIPLNNVYDITTLTRMYARTYNKDFCSDLLNEVLQTLNIGSIFEKLECYLESMEPPYKYPDGCLSSLYLKKARTCEKIMRGLEILVALGIECLERKRINHTSLNEIQTIKKRIYKELE